MLFFLQKVLLSGNKLDVKIFEPNVDIIAIQGPKSFSLMEKIFGKTITGNQSILGDIRYSMLPNSASPLWGITINPNKADEHAPYLTMRKNNAKIRQQYIDMILGKDIKK